MNVIYHLETISREGATDWRTRDRVSDYYGHQSLAPSWRWNLQVRVERQSIVERGRQQLERFTYWHLRSRQRRQLRQLADDQDLLYDIGLCRADALREASKPFWRD